MEKSKLFNKIIILFIVFSPILDAISIVCDKYLKLPFTIGMIIRGIFFGLILINIIRNKDNRKVLFLFLIYVILSLSSYFMRKFNIYYEIINMARLFYLPVMMIFFSKYKNEYINDKFILKVYLLYLVTGIILHVFKLDINYLNTISAVIIGLLPVVLNCIIDAKSYLIKILFYILLFASVYLLSTKLLIIGTFIIFIIVFISKNKLKFMYNDGKKKAFIIFSLIMFIIAYMLLVRFSPFYTNITKEISSLNINSFSDIYRFKTIDTLIFNGRLSVLKDNLKLFSGYESIMYGVGVTNAKTTSIDPLDILFKTGIFGSVIFTLMFIYVHVKTELKKVYYGSYLTFMIISIFFGLVLVSPSVSIFIALLYLVSSNSVKIEKKKILLVSNMYPSKKYSHYGVFVKRVKEILDKKYDVDKVVMHKEEKFINKLFSYMSLYLGVIIKCMFNNYDYIYVHFISHSSFGAYITKLTSKDVKLVLNAHGNDVIDDQKIDLKNMKKSKVYIKKADMVVVPSEYFKKVIIDNYNYDENNIIVYPSGGVNTSFYKDLDKDECKEKLNLNKKYNYVGFASRIEKDKGYDVYLRFIKELEKEKKIGNYRFLVVGTGSEENKLNKLIKDLSLEKYVEVRSILPPSELLYFYNAIDVFVFPTYRRSESLGLVGLEAMSCKTFVIASDNYGPSSYVRDNKNGFTFKAKDPIDLKNRFLEYTTINNEKLNKIISKAESTAKEYDEKNTEKIILSVFK